MGDRVLVTALIIPVFSNSCSYYREIFLSVGSSADHDKIVRVITNVTILDMLYLPVNNDSR